MVNRYLESRILIKLSGLKPTISYLWRQRLELTNG
jgi:hypothetical protein